MFEKTIGNVLLLFIKGFIIFIWATVKISEDQFSREGLKMTSDMHETL